MKGQIFQHLCLHVTAVLRTPPPSFVSFTQLVPTFFVIWWSGDPPPRTLSVLPLLNQYQAPSKHVIMT